MRWSEKCGWDDISAERFIMDYEQYKEQLTKLSDHPLVYMLDFDEIRAELASISNFVASEIDDLDLNRIRRKTIRHSPNFHQSI